MSSKGSRHFRPEGSGLPASPGSLPAASSRPARAPPSASTPSGSTSSTTRTGQPSGPDVPVVGRAITRTAGVLYPLGFFAPPRTTSHGLTAIPSPPAVLSCSHHKVPASTCAGSRTSTMRDRVSRKGRRAGRHQRTPRRIDLIPRISRGRCRSCVSVTDHAPTVTCDFCTMQFALVRSSQPSKLVNVR